MPAKRRDFSGNELEQSKNDLLLVLNINRSAARGKARGIFLKVYKKFLSRGCAPAKTVLK